MSALGSGEVLKPILLRSSTPGPNEKVWKYLEGMRNSADMTPPPSALGLEDYRSTLKSPVSDRKGSKLRSHSEHLDDLAKSDVSYGGRNDDADEIKSNTQVGTRSELDLNTNALGDHEVFSHEPGPNDPPGPHYESYDSGPSFGNFGPLPPDENHTTQWQQGYGRAPNAASYPLPESIASPREASIRIGVESPSNPSSRQRSKASQKSPSVISRDGNRTANAPMSPSKGRSRQEHSIVNDQPLSPSLSKPRTEYPPLPESAYDDGLTSAMGPMSPTTYKSRSKAPSKAPSISPSDSPSQPRHKSSSKADSKKLTRSSATKSPAPSASHQSRPFSPYRHAATTEDLMHAAIRGRAFIPDTIEENDGTQTSTHSQQNVPQSPKKQRANPSVASQAKTKSVASDAFPNREDNNATPTPGSQASLAEVNKEEEDIVMGLRKNFHQTPRTSYYAASALETEVVNSHFHDNELCDLLHEESNPKTPEAVKRVLRKAIRSRVKKLGLRYDNDAIQQYRKAAHDHASSVHGRHDDTPYNPEDPPEWAKEIIQGMVVMQQRIEGLGPKIEGLKLSQSPPPISGSRFNAMDYDDGEDYSRSNMTQTVNIHTQPTGTMADSMYQQPDTEVIDQSNQGGPEDEDYRDEQQDQTIGPTTEGGTYTRRAHSDLLSENRDDSPGQQFLEEELYKLRQRPTGSQSGHSHRTWEVARDDGTGVDEFDDENQDQAGAPTIPDSAYTDRRAGTPSPPSNHPDDRVSSPQQAWHNGADFNETPLAPWQRIHQRLLGWAIIWPMSELDNALTSTTRGHQVDEVALSIWSTQTYKRYVRARMTDSPQGVVDRLFVPPNIADAISSAVFNGRHGDACGMLRDLWSPFGLEGMPRLLVVLAKHRNDPDHWIVHRFSLPDGSLTTYDCHPGRALHDGRPLGWWFAIRIAWPNALYPSPDHLLQKMVRLHRPMQLPIDNSVAAAGIWRNILMGSRAERSLDLERLRDLINTEVKNLRQRKEMGKLSVSGQRPTWEDMN